MAHLFLEMRGFLKKLEEEKELVRVLREVDPRNFELPSVIRKVEEEHGKAVLLKESRTFRICELWRTSMVRCIESPWV